MCPVAYTVSSVPPTHSVLSQLQSQTSTVQKDLEHMPDNSQIQTMTEYSLQHNQVTQ